MRSSAIIALLAVSATHAACSEPEFSPIELEDSGPASERRDGGMTADAKNPADTPSDDLVCESSGMAVCTPSACISVCHTRQGSVATGAACTVFSGPDPSRYDDCAVGNVCLTDGFGASHCFGLCRSTVDCVAGRACAPRALGGGTSIRVCDPPYRNCSSTSEPCCDPLAKDSCGPGKYCYLIPPQTGSEDSWTVCDYVTGGGLRGQSCTSSRDCLLGLACLLPTASSPAGECQQVCNPMDASSCATGTCVPYGKQWGICSS